MPDRFAEVVEGLYRGGRPSPNDLVALKEIWGINKIVSLDEESGKAIKPICKDLGIDQIIWGLGDGTDPKVAALKSKIVPHLLKGGPTYVHCFHGKDRTGMCIGMFRVYNGWPVEKALREAASFGMGKDLDAQTRDSYYKAVIDFSKDKDINDIDVVTKTRQTNEFGTSNPGVNNQNIPDSTLNHFIPPHADPEYGPLDRIAFGKVYCKCKSNKLLQPNITWWSTKDLAVKNPTDKDGNLFSASFSPNTRIERFDGKPSVSRSNALTRDIDVAGFRDNSFLVVYPNILDSIQEEDDVNAVVEVGMRDTSTDAPRAYPGSGVGIGGMPSGAGIGEGTPDGAAGMPDGAAGVSIQPFTGPGSV